MTFRELREPDLEDVADLVVRCDAQTADWAPPGWTLPDGHAERELEVWRQDLDGGDLWAEVVTDEEGKVVGVVAVPVLADRRLCTGHARMTTARGGVRGCAQNQYG